MKSDKACWGLLSSAEIGKGLVRSAGVCWSLLRSAGVA